MLKKYQKSLRTNQTDSESQLWFFLRARRFYGFKFRRQQILFGFIVDFVCYEKKLIIELDGGQHNELENQKQDQIRTQVFKKNGFNILRFWNIDLLNERESVLNVIYDTLHQSPPQL